MRSVFITIDRNTRVLVAVLLILGGLAGCRQTVMYDLGDLPDDPGYTREITRTLCIDRVAAEERPTVCSLMLVIHSELVGTRWKDGEVVEQTHMESRLPPDRPLHTLLCNDRPVPDRAHVSFVEPDREVGKDEYLLRVRLAELPLDLLDEPKLTLTISTCWAGGTENEEIITGTFDLENPCCGDRDLRVIRRRFEGREGTPDYFLAMAGWHDSSCGRTAESSDYIDRAFDTLEGEFHEGIWEAKARSLVLQGRFGEGGGLYKDLFEETRNTDHGIEAATNYLRASSDRDLLRARQLLKRSLCDAAPEDWRVWHMLFSADYRLEPVFIESCFLDEAMLALRRAMALHENPGELAQSMRDLEARLDAGLTRGYKEAYAERRETLGNDPAAYNRVSEEGNALIAEQNVLDDFIERGLFPETIERSQALRKKEWVGLLNAIEALCWNNIGCATAEAERWAEAAECFEKAFALDPRDRSGKTGPDGKPIVIPFRLNAGVANWQAGKEHPIASEARLRHWRRAAEYVPENGTYRSGAKDGMTFLEAFSEASQSIAKVWEAQAEYSKAVDDLEKAIAGANDALAAVAPAFDGEDAALRGRLAEGDALLAAGKHGEALDLFAGLLEEHPGAAVHARLGRAHAAEGGDLDAAERHLLAALDLYGTEGDAGLTEFETKERMAECHYLRALVLEMRLDRVMTSGGADGELAFRHLQGAMNEARRAMRLDGRNRTYRECYGRLRQSRGKVTLLLDPDARNEAERKEREREKGILRTDSARSP